METDKSASRGRTLRERPLDEPAYDEWLTALIERTDPFMAFLSVVFTLLVGFELVVELAPRTALVLTYLGWVVWAVFAMDYAVKLWLAPNKTHFLRHHWVQALGLLLPTLRVFSFVRLFRLGRALPAARVMFTSYRSAGTARRLLRSRLGYLAAFVCHCHTYSERIDFRLRERRRHVPHLLRRVHLVDQPHHRHAGRPTSGDLAG